MEITWKNLFDIGKTQKLKKLKNKLKNIKKLI